MLGAHFIVKYPASFLGPGNVATTEPRGVPLNTGNGAAGAQGGPEEDICFYGTVPVRANHACHHQMCCSLIKFVQLRTQEFPTLLAPILVGEDDLASIAHAQFSAKLCLMRKSQQSLIFHALCMCSATFH